MLNDNFTAKDMMCLMDLSECAMFSVLGDPEVTLVYGNRTLFSLIQYTKEEFKEKFNNHLMELLPEDEKQKVRVLAARQAAMGGLLNLEFRIKRKDGTMLWIALSAKLQHINGAIQYYCSCMNISKQKRNIDELYNAKREVDIITNSIPGGVIKLRANDFTLLYANDGFYRISGYSRGEYFSLFGNHCNKVIYSEDAPMVNKLLQSAVDNNGSLGVEYRIVDKNGDIRWSYVNGRRVDDNNGSAVYLCIIMDITAKKKLERKLEDNVRRTKYLNEYRGEVEWTYHIDSDKFCRSGKAVAFSDFEEYPNFLQNNYFNNFVHPDDIEKIKRDLQKRIEVAGESEGVYRMKNSRGEYLPMNTCMVSISINDDGKPDRVYGSVRVEKTKKIDMDVMVASDVSEISIKDTVENLAGNTIRKKKDIVTNMMSKEEFSTAFECEMKNRSEEDNFGVLCLDINEFQKLNFHYGLSSGNEILKLFGDVIKKRIAYNNICTRVEGDYFAVLFKYDDYAEILKQISRIMKEMTEKEKELTYKTYGSTSGIYMIKADDTDFERMLENADMARKSIKGTKGNHFCIYSEDLEKENFYEEELINDIINAIKNNTVEICYQPRIKNDKENVIGCKVVPQVQSKNGEYISLEDIKRYIDRTDKIQRLVFYILSNVCRTQGAWKAGGKEIMPISLDITQGQLCMQNAVDKIDEIVKENKLTPSDIIFEIQERYFRDMTPNFQHVLEDLNSRGYRFIISRFGSDHIAIQAMRHLPVYGIKFHGEFFTDNMNVEKETLIFKRIVGLAKEMGLATSCGGIHTNMQEDIARSIGCDILEGDLYYGTVRNDVYEKCFLN